MTNFPRPRRAFLLLAACASVAVVAKTVDTRYPWLWAYLADRLSPRPSEASAGPRHILFTFVDHFEPRDQATMDRWMRAYPTMARRHRDADGRLPQHTWFWYFKDSDEAQTLSFLQQLAQLAYQGFGEVELHSHPQRQTEPAFLEHMRRRLLLSRRTGALLTAEPEPRMVFGFIHGLWSLDNSRGGAICGLNNELILLKQLGCYADFTHPSWGRMHPRIVNRLYYATDDPTRPKSYDTGTVLQAGGQVVGDLLIFEGPSVVRWRGLRPVYDHGDVTMEDLPLPERVDGWVDAGIHVQGRPEWVFVKVFTHGAIASDEEAVLGSWRHRLHTYLEARYNDGVDYVLHYVTAREAYNIAKAAEAGHGGDPNAYRDFLIPPYVNRRFVASAPFEVIAMDEQRWTVWFLAEPGRRVEVRLRLPAVRVEGDARKVSVRSEDSESLISFELVEDGLVEFMPRALGPQKEARLRTSELGVPHAQ